MIDDKVGGSKNHVVSQAHVRGSVGLKWIWVYKKQPISATLGPVRITI